MLQKVILVFVILGTVNSEPIKRSIVLSNDVLTSLFNDYAEQFEISIGPETIASMKNLVNNAVGLKLSAAEIAVKMVKWFTSNLIGIAIGSVIAIGICKITGKWDFNFDHTFSKIYSALTSNQLEMTENLLISALRRYAEEEEGKKDVDEKDLDESDADEREDID